jgi:hypothetical protein
MAQESEKTSPDAIEITPTMIQAGMEAFVEHDPRFEGLDEAVIRIFRRMVQEVRE